MNEKKRARGDGRIFMRGSRYWLQYSEHGKQIRVSAGTDDEKKAERELKKRVGQVMNGIHRDTRRVNYETLRESYYADYEINRRKSLRRDKEGKPYLDKVGRLDNFFSGFRASDIDTDLIRKFIADQQGRELSNGSINRSLSALRRMFNIAKKDGKLTLAPHFPMLKEAAPRQGFLEREQYEALSRCLPDYLRLPFSIAYFTAMRLEEVLGLQWPQIDFLTNEIALHAGETKNDEGRIVPIIAELRTLLREQFARRQPSCPWVCFRLERTGQAVKINSFRKAWYTACCTAGLGKMVAASDSKKKKVYVGTIFHDLRRSGVRNMIRAGIPEQVCMAISGHKTRSTFSRYNITSANDISDARKKLAVFHSKKNRDNSGTMRTNVVQSVSLTN